MTTIRYSLAAIILHWLLALLLAFQISLGWTLNGANTPELFARFQLHKSVGITILLLTLARLAIRFAVARPALSESSAWVRRLAGAVHGLFYMVMIIGPITGWIIASTARIKVPTLLYGIVPWPHLPVGDGWHAMAESIHEALAWLAIGLFALHVIGALRHQWLLGKPELQRMIPFARGNSVGAAIVALALISGAWVAAKNTHLDHHRTAPVAKKLAPPMPRSIAAAKHLPETKASAVGEKQEAVKDDARQPLAVWSVAPDGRLGFTAHWNGEAVDGRFAQWHAAIRFSRDELAASRIRVTVDLASADTGDGQRDVSLKGSDFFDVATHPGAVFVARDIRHLDGDRYEARGSLDLRGITKPVILRFTLRIDGDRARVAGTARIDRTAFGVGQGEWATTAAIASGVDVYFSFTATRPAA